MSETTIIKSTQTIFGFTLSDGESKTMTFFTGLEKYDRPSEN